MSRGRTPLPVGQARSVILRVRVRPSAAEAFRSEAKKRGLNESEAHRQALAQWMRSK